MAFSMRGRTQTALADINITPLVDVVLVLLLIFMLTAPVLQSGTDRAINIHDLTNALGPSLPGSKRVVYIRADKQVQFGAFASVMDSIKQAGITNISIITHPIENSSQQ